MSSFGLLNFRGILPIEFWPDVLLGEIFPPKSFDCFRSEFGSSASGCFMGPGSLISTSQISSVVLIRWALALE